MRSSPSVQPEDSPPSWWPCLRKLACQETASKVVAMPELWVDCVSDLCLEDVWVSEVLVAVFGVAWKA
jgi:hypothetical protein